MAMEDYFFGCPDEVPDSDPLHYPVGYWKDRLIIDLETSHIKNILNIFSKKRSIEDKKLIELENELRFRVLEKKIKILESRL